MGYQAEKEVWRYLIQPSGYNTRYSNLPDRHTDGHT